MSKNSESWPNFFIVGAPRAGTTSLYDMLNRTKGVYMSPVKEPHYFSRIDESILYPVPIRNKKKYLDLFQNVKDEKAMGEGSTSYIGDPYSHQLIHQVVPDAKIIMILRDPVNLAYSRYMFRLGYGKTYSFADAIKDALENRDDYRKGITVNAGYYSAQVKRYLDTFGQRQLKVLIFEEFVVNPQSIVKQVLEFLGVNAKLPETLELVHNTMTEPRGHLSTLLLQNENIRKFARKFIPENISEFTVRKILGEKIPKPKIPEKERLFLQKLYHDDVKKLETILNRKFPWPNFQN